MRSPLPISLGPRDDWDPQGYEDDEGEDVLAAGMHFMGDDDDDPKKSEDDDDDEVAVVDAIVDPDLVDEDEEDESEETDGLLTERSAIEELEELESVVRRTERDTLRLSDYVDDDE